MYHRIRIESIGNSRGRMGRGWTKIDLKNVGFVYEWQESGFSRIDGDFQGIVGGYLRSMSLQLWRWRFLGSMSVRVWRWTKEGF